MQERVFLDTCVIYAYLNDPDPFHMRAHSIFEEHLENEDNLVISQYVLYEFILLSKRRAAEEYFEQNISEKVIPNQVNENLNKKINEQLELLDILGLEINYLELPEDITRNLKQLTYKIKAQQIIRKNKNKFVKITGVLDLIHIISCYLLQCNRLITSDSDFSKKPLSVAFKNQFVIKII